MSVVRYDDWKSRDRGAEAEEEAEVAPLDPEDRKLYRYWLGPPPPHPRRDPSDDIPFSDCRRVR